MKRSIWLTWLTASLLVLPAVPVVVTCCEDPPPCCEEVADLCPVPGECTILPAADHPPGALPASITPERPVAVVAAFTGPDDASLLSGPADATRAPRARARLLLLRVLRL